MTTQIEEIPRGTEVVSTERVLINYRLILNPGAKGVVVELDPHDSTVAMVAFRVPKTPDRCEKCGRMSGLSVNGGTGEIECLASGCGHEHGFCAATVILPLSSLRTYASYINEIEKKDWESRRASQKSLVEANTQGLTDLNEEGRRRGWVQ